MKKIIYFLSEIRSNLLMDVFLIFIITYSLIQLNDAIGEFRYNNKSGSLIAENFDGEKDMYYMEIGEPALSDSTEQEFVERMEFVGQLKQMDGIEAVIGIYSFNQKYNGIVNGTKIASSYLMKLFPNVNEGKWPSEIYDENGNVNAVICGTNWNDISVGEYLELSDGRKIRVVGKLYNPCIVPSMSGGASFINAMSIINASNGSIVLPECEESMDMYELSGRAKWDVLSYRNFFVKFKNEVSQEQIKAVKAVLESRGRVIPINEILENTDATINITIRKGMVKPIFYLWISGIIFFCMSAIYVMRCVKKNAVAYMLGESQMGIVINVVTRIVVLLVISIGIGIVHIIKCINDIKQSVEFIPGEEMLCDGTSVGILCIIGGVMLIINIVMTVIILNNNSPIEFWNKARE